MLLRALALVLIFSGCGRYERKSETYSATATVSEHFSSIYTRIIAPKCLQCHGTSGEEPHLTSYSGVVSEVRPGDPTRSELYKEVERGKMPIGQPMLNDDELLALYLWIRNGAAND